MTVIVLGILGFAVIVLIGAIALVTVTFSRSLQKALDSIDRVHERNQAHLSSVLDRLMAKNFEDFKTYDLGERGMMGEVEYPDEAEDRPWTVPAFVAPGKGLAGGDKIIEPEEDE